MAAIVKKKRSFCVVYNYTDDKGRKKQKWESFKTAGEAKKRKSEVEYKIMTNTLVVPTCITVNELLDEYVELYGKNKWAISTYQSKVALMNNYIRPFIGNMKLTKLTTQVINTFYQTLLTTKPVRAGKRIPRSEFVTPRQVLEVHKLLKSCFSMAVKWEIMGRNPAEHAILHPVESQSRDIWTAETFFHALELCEDARLALAMNLAFSCSLRMGELLGLTWDCVDISSESIENGSAYIYVEKELQRVRREAMEALGSKDVMRVFPAASKTTATVLVLKKPKTKTSVRKIFLPQTVAKMLVAWKEQQEATREYLGEEYQDYNLVMASPMGLPTEGSTINDAFHKLIEDNHLPPVVFHSFRHASVTYKLKLTGGDIKSVQGDSGHAQGKMVTDVYSHIIDDERKNTARLFENAFYAKKCDEEQETSEELVRKLLKNPELTKLLMALTKME